MGAKFWLSALSQLLLFGIPYPVLEYYKEHVHPQSGKKCTYGNFNGTLGNLGRDGQSLEEGRLLRTQAGVLGRDDDRAGSNRAGPGGGLDLVLEQFVPNFHQVAPCEDKANIALDVR